MAIYKYPLPAQCVPVISLFTANIENNQRAFHCKGFLQQGNKILAFCFFRSCIINRVNASGNEGDDINIPIHRRIERKP
ncbi:MAG: hypothetical protein B6245_22330 [Desulfobacteraceae bacterium 4572_88]|nr:MAG: hypothetical protein B6245_22330 [Desulfobacteraceae bacterium 4572_88]